MAQQNLLQHYKALMAKRFATLNEYQKHKIIGSVYLVLTLFTVSVFGIFAIQPTLSTISTLQRTYEDNKIIDEKLTQKLNILRQLRQEYQELQPSLHLVSDALPAQPTIPLFIRKLEILARENTVGIENLHVGEVELYPHKNTTQKEKAIEFDLAVIAPEENIDAFLVALTSFDRVLSLKAVGKERDNKDNVLSPNYKLSISGTFYFFE